MEHAPFLISVIDPRLSGARPFNLVSVHMPPSSSERRGARDAQIKKLLALYPQRAELRLNKPFTRTGAANARQPPAVHVLCGDWNSDKPTLERLAKEAHARSSWEVLECEETSSGRRAYDNFVINAEARTDFAVGHEVRHLATMQKSCAGVLGLSDHSPIALRLTLLNRRKVTDLQFAGGEGVFLGAC
jgi:endonuclease/exonuclease/phosphatase family metal-dependent hydrolase